MLSFLFRLIFCLSIVIAPMHLFAAYAPSATTYLYGGSAPEFLFSSGTTPWAGPSPSPVKIDLSYQISGHTWTDAIGWSQFDHGVAGNQARFDAGCMTGTDLTCPLLGHLWSPMAGWIALEGQGIIYTKSTGIINGTASSTTVGNIAFNSELWAMPIVLTGANLVNDGPFSDHTFANSSVTLAAVVPAWILTRGTTIISMQLCPVGYLVLCRPYTYSVGAGGFTNVDLSIATDYTYTITDPFGSLTTGSIKVYAGNISQAANVNGATLLTSFCIPANIPSPLCPDGSTPRTTWAGGDLANPLGSKFADAVEKFSGTINLRDVYGNRLQSEGAIGRTITYSVGINSNAFMNTLSGNPTAYGRNDILGQTSQAYRFYDTVTMTNPNISPSPFVNTYTPGREFSLSSYVPTSAGNPIVLNNNFNISNVSATVSGPNTHSADITGKFQVANFPFLPLYRVSGIIGLSGQIGRPTTIESSIRRTDPNNKSTNTHIIHGLSIVTTVGSIPNLASTFQDITDILPIQDCLAYIPSGGYAGYCERGIPAGGDKASVISLPATGDEIHRFTTTPRRINTVNIEQSYAYDSIITYKIDGQDITYPSLSQGTAAQSDSVFAGGVKILGQSSGDRIYQSISDMYQPKNASVRRTEILNEIRKNISILTRNANYTSSIYTGANLIVYSGSRNMNAAQLSLLDTHAALVVYGDVTISANYVLPNTQTPPRVIIALKDANDTGGNIYIKDTVTRLDASLISERSLLSGDPGNGTPYYTDLSNATGVLDKQLYVYGSIISLNTIGGASIPGSPVCPVSIDGCNTDSKIPLRYDFEHFRYYRGVSPAPLARAAANLSINDKKASFIIEYDNRIISNPPPGLAPIR